MQQERTALLVWPPIMDIRLLDFFREWKFNSEEIAERVQMLVMFEEQESRKLQEKHDYHAL